MLSHQFSEALTWATDLHKNQTRKPSKSPYIAHLLGVAGLVLESDGTEEQAMPKARFAHAALLHDSIEDQGVTVEEIASRFSQEVADLVDIVTESYSHPKPEWLERKKGYLDKLRNSSREAVLISLADKLHNARALEEGLHFNTLIKEEFFRAIEGFALALRQQLPGEIAPTIDINTIKRHLSGYLEALWTEFFNVQQAEIRTKLISEMQRISTKVEEDLKELVGDKAINIDTLLTGFDPTPANLRSFLVPRREKNQFGFAATGLELGGFFLLMANLPLGLAAIGSGQVMRLLGRKMTENSDREALLTSAMEAVRELEKQIKQQVNQQFTEFTQQLKDAIADLYNQGITKIRQSLEEAIDSHQQLVVEKEKIGRLDRETIPELRQLFHKIFNITHPI